MSERGEMRIFGDSDALSRALSVYFAECAAAAIAERAAFRVALSGGKTPRASYQLLATAPFRDQIEWSRVFVYFGDERCVPPGDERSNYHMASTALLDAVPIPAGNVHRMQGEADPAVAANEYATLLRTELGNRPQFDLVMLGLGADGHTASLFPGSDPAGNDEVLVRAVDAPDHTLWRITLTPVVINAARGVVFAVEGEEKARALAAVYDGPRDPATYPAQVVAPKSGRLVWLVDETAARLLQPG